MESSGEEVVRDQTQRGNKKYLKKIRELAAAGVFQGSPKHSEQLEALERLKRQDERLEVKSLKSKATTKAQSTTNETSTPTHADQRKERNKESAKNTRKRKKIYIELLENKISELTMELNFIQDQIKLAKINRNTDNIMKIIYCFKNLGESEDTQTLESARDNLQMMRSKSCMQIPERRQLIQSHLDQFLDHCQTPFIRYFGNAALQGKDFFAPEKDRKNPASDVFHFLKEELSLNKQQLAELRALEPGFLSLGKKFKE